MKDNNKFLAYLCKKFIKITKLIINDTNYYKIRRIKRRKQSEKKLHIKNNISYSFENSITLSCNKGNR